LTYNALKLTNEYYLRIYTKLIKNIDYEIGKKHIMIMKQMKDMIEYF